MDYKDLYNEAIGDLKTNRAKEAFKKMIAMAKYNPNSKILDIKRGPLLGKFRQDTKGKLLIDEKEINQEI